ncbi:MAG TPA: amylo-alpha-1,6-glucosidase [Micrococcales bacterium]|nr:amylo-alpha-1,6-glucosidase [Micrococcales bacterium]
MSLQPLLHDLLATVCAPTQLWTGPDGSVAPGGAQGLFHADVRALSFLDVLVDGARPETVAVGPRAAGSSEVVSLTRGIDGPGADPTAWLRRQATVRPGLLELDLLLECSTPQPVAGRLEVVLASDLASLEVVKQGLSVIERVPAVEETTVRWEGGTAVVDVTAEGAEVEVRGTRVVLGWDVRVAPGDGERRRVRVAVADSGAIVRAPATREPEWVRPALHCDDSRLERLMQRSLDDLASLRMSWTGADADDVFLAAGAPWFFTLFGRDSIWAARMLLPLGTDLARGTLRTLAAGQGTTSDVATAEQPGKILHEVRSATLSLGDGTALPPVYYGTVDATALWICLLHDAWRWGMAEEDVRALLPHLERALAWLRDYGDADGDGFLDYVDATGSGLSNQGWKDSGDSVQWRDGRLAEGPIALSEVQAYAYEAAVGGAALLDAFERPGATAWRAWAAGLADRFRARFWTADDDGPYLGIALDRSGALIDSVASNMGHVVGTGILTPEEERVVADRLVSPELSSGYGLRTLSDRMAGYWPLGYHRGSVWAHDTAIAISGLARAGLDEQAAVLVRGVLAAAESVRYQLPELYGGAPPESMPGVVPYPAACHPQAWSAASAVAILQACLGLAPGAERGGPPRALGSGAAPVGRVDVEGVVAGGRVWHVSAPVGGTPTVTPADGDGARSAVGRA